MTATATGGDVLTMSSREIAELVGSRHDSVKRTIERCAEKGVLTLPPLVETSFKGADGRGQMVSVYNLDKRSSLIVVAQLCPEFTARIVDRWQELEAQVAAPLPAPAINVNVLADAVDRGLMSKRTASGMIKAWLLAQNPAMAAVLAAQQVRPATAQAPVQLQLETKPQPKLKPAPKPFKLTVTRNRNTVDGVNFVLNEVASHCGVSFDDLLRSMRDHGLIDQAGQTMARGREFVAFTKRGSRHWKVGALIRHLSA